MENGHICLLVSDGGLQEIIHCFYGRSISCIAVLIWTIFYIY